MIKKFVMIIIACFAVVSLLTAEEKKDTTSSSSGSIIKTQTNSKTLSNQTNIIPQKKTNWSKIKDLFM